MSKVLYPCIQYELVNYYKFLRVTHTFYTKFMWESSIKDVTAIFPKCTNNLFKIIENTKKSLSTSVWFKKRTFAKQQINCFLD